MSQKNHEIVAKVSQVGINSWESEEVVVCQLRGGVNATAKLDGFSLRRGPTEK